MLVKERETDINTPKIRTKRLLLRQFTLDDVSAFYEIMSDAEVNTFLPWFPLKTIEEAKEYLQENYLKSYEKSLGFRYAICLQSNNIPIGYVNVGDSDSFDFGYGVRKEYWRKGFAAEACKAVAQQLLFSGIPYITATHDINNPRSGNVMKKIGMTYCYSYEERCQPKDTLVVFRLYQLNLDGNDDRVYQQYWDRYANHFIEENP